MRIKTVCVMFFFIMAICLSAIQDADAARRFGGGKSFGSKPSTQRSTTVPKQQSPAVSQNSSTSATTSSATKSGTTASKKSGIGGMVGGLLAGTVIGAMIFGDDDDDDYEEIGDGGGGAGLFDILILALLLYLGFKLFARFRRKSTPQMAGAGANASQNTTMQRTTPNNAGSWNNLQGGAQQTQNPQIPAGFAVEEFLEGAKMAFTRLQKSWDNRDLDDIALFTSPAVYEEVKRQLEEDNSPSKTDVLLSNARLLSVTQENGEEIATVYFDVIMRESDATQTTQVREVWHFTRPLSGGNWKLDGLQQIED